MTSLSTRTFRGKSASLNTCLSPTTSTGDFRHKRISINIKCKAFIISVSMVFDSLLIERLERWLRLMLKWSAQERGKDPDATPMDCFSRLEVILQLKVN